MKSHPPVPITAARPLPGFTLVELAVVLAVIVVVFSIAAPAMTEFTTRNQVVATRSSFSAAVALARSEAAKRSRQVILQPLGGGRTGNEFAAGWELVVDEDGNGTASETELRVRRYPALATAVSLSGPGSLMFRASGALGSASDQVFTVCRSGNASGYSVTVTPSGLADVASVDDCAT